MLKESKTVSQQHLRDHLVADCKLNTSLSPGNYVCVLAGRLVKTLAVTGVSGHAILPGIITPPITQAHCVHYSCPQRSSSEAVTAGAVTGLSITGAHAVCSSDPTVTWQPTVQLSSAVESGSQLGVIDQHPFTSKSKHKVIWRIPLLKMLCLQ